MLVPPGHEDMKIQGIGDGGSVLLTIVAVRGTGADHGNRVFQPIAAASVLRDFCPTANFNAADRTSPRGPFPCTAKRKSENNDVER